MDKIALISLVKSSYGCIPFPEEQGLRASMACDDWVSDPAKLKRITEEQDIKGEWWEIPKEELQACTLGLSYLTPSAAQFYLPAYMMLALEEFEYKNYTHVMGFLDPKLASDDDVKLQKLLYDDFCNKLALLTVRQKLACIKVLEYVKENIPKDAVLYESRRKKIKRILEHEFWSTR